MANRAAWPFDAGSRGAAGTNGQDGVSLRRMDEFFLKPILNSPYEYPGLTGNWTRPDSPTNRILDQRRSVSLITPIPAARKQRAQRQLVFDKAAEKLDTDGQQYDPTPVINDLRRIVDAWRELPANQWQVTPETARLLHHWRHHATPGIRPFFCQVEAVETAIWLTEVATRSATGRRFLEHLRSANRAVESRSGSPRPQARYRRRQDNRHGHAHRLAVRQRGAPPGSRRFTRGFLVVTPG